MRIELLGTASSEGIPGLFCSCRICRTAHAAGGREIRTRSSALIDGILKIDLPPDIHTQCVRFGVDLTSIEALLFTHAHDDHFAPAELQYRGVYFTEHRLTTPLPIFGPPEVICRIAERLNPSLVSYQLQTIEPEKMVDIAGYSIFPFRANHDDAILCLNYLITAPDGATLLYASDTGWYPESTWDLLARFRIDAVVVECSKAESGGYPGHLSIGEVIALRERLIDLGALHTSAQVVATHFSHLMGMLHADLETRLAPEGVTTSYDGYSFDVAALTRTLG